MRKGRFASCVALGALALAWGAGCGSSDSSNGFSGDDGGAPAGQDGGGSHKDAAGSVEDSAPPPDATTGDDTGGDDSATGDSTVSGDGPAGEAGGDGTASGGEGGASEGGLDATLGDGGTGEAASSDGSGEEGVAGDAVADGPAGDAAEDAASTDAGTDGGPADGGAEAESEAGGEAGTEAGAEGGTEAGPDANAEAGDAGFGPMCQTDAGASLCAAGEHCCVSATTQAESCNTSCPSGTNPVDCIGATDSDAAVGQCGSQQCCGSLTLTGNGASCAASAVTSSCQPTCNDTAPVTCTAGTYTIQLCNSQADCAGNQGNQTRCCQFGVSPLYWCTTLLESIIANNCL